jgi:hypothetical protein
VQVGQSPNDTAPFVPMMDAAHRTDFSLRTELDGSRSKGEDTVRAATAMNRAGDRVHPTVGTNIRSNPATLALGRAGGSSPASVPSVRLMLGA